MVKSFQGREDAEILRRQRETILRARQQAPRWIKPEVLLNCEPVGKVWLNPENGQLREAQSVAHA